MILFYPYKSPYNKGSVMYHHDMIREAKERLRRYPETHYMLKSKVVHYLMSYHLRKMRELHASLIKTY